MISVFHLVRMQNGLEPLRRFVETYVRYPAGADHRLVAVFKGFPSERATEEFRDVLDQVGEFDSLHVADDVLDVSAYARSVQQLRSVGPAVCFLNSFSRVQADNWLGLLTDPLSDREIGLVGATGSWASHRSYAFHLIGLPTPYRAVLPSRVEFRQVAGSISAAPPPSRIRSIAKSLSSLPGEIIGYGGFPAPHIRTNGFAMRTADFIRYSSESIRRKSVAYRFESGTRGLTSQVLSAGKRAVVIDSSGHRFEIDQWPVSETFWQGTQRGLLIADNQTDSYAKASPDARAALSALAWGDRAR